MAKNKYTPREFILKFKTGYTPQDLQNQIQLFRKRQTTLPGQILNFGQKIKQIVTQTPDPQNLLKQFETLNQQVKILSQKKLVYLKNPSNKIQNLYLFQTQSDLTIEQVINLYKNLSIVDYVEPNYLFTVTIVPNDTYYPQQWNLPKISLPQAWDITTGSDETIVGLLDTGVDYQHPDLPQSRIIKGYDFVNNDADPFDDHGHGTAIAGLINAVSNNSQGITGINWQSQLLAVKALDNTGQGELAEIIQGMTYAVDQGADVLNLSFLADAHCSQILSLQETIDYALSQNTSIIVAAGNENQNANNFSPSSCSGVIVVAATDINDSRAPYSNYGQVVDIAAPGGTSDNSSNMIFSTYPDSSYVYAYGTSLAAPHVTGAAALMLALNPDLTPAEIELALKNNADAIDTDQPIGKRLNVYTALRALIQSSPSPTVFPSSAPSATPAYTLSDLQNLLNLYLNPDDADYHPVDGKINMLDVGYIISFLIP